MRPVILKSFIHLASIHETKSRVSCQSSQIKVTKTQFFLTRKELMDLDWAFQR